MSAYRRTARACALGAGASAAAGLYPATFHPWLIVFGLYACGFFTWCAARYSAAHRRQLAEEAWEERRVLGERPEPLDPCCTLAHRSDGAAHDRRKCTDLLHRTTAPIHE